MTRGFKGGICRLRDVVCAAAGLAILSPLLAVIALAIKFQDGGPVFYSQWRVGRRFRPFRLYKVRSMVVGADRLGRPLTAPQDSRLTPLGPLLRRYKLDELPQLLNVLKGDMQMVGARPEVDRYVSLFPEEYSTLLRDRPGITDPASVAYRHEDQLFRSGDVEKEYIERILPAKLKISLDYACCRSLASDLMVILSTLFGATCLVDRVCMSMAKSRAAQIHT